VFQSVAAATGKERLNVLVGVALLQKLCKDTNCDSLDWVLSHGAIHRFICDYVCVYFMFPLSTAYLFYYCNMVGWT